MEEDIKKLFLLYNSALSIVFNKVKVLSEGFKLTNTATIEHIKTRVKTIDSIKNKLNRKKLEHTTENITNSVEDIAGVRIICLFYDDIYKIVDLIKLQDDLKVIKEKDYVKNPKISGYRSYHMVVLVPVYINCEKQDVKVEIQIRTASMDFFSALEHKAKYKCSQELPEHLLKELRVCADKIEELDKRMYLINDIIKLIKNE